MHNKCCNTFYCIVYFVSLHMKPHRYLQAFEEFLCDGDRCWRVRVKQVSAATHLLPSIFQHCRHQLQPHWHDRCNVIRNVTKFKFEFDDVRILAIKLVLLHIGSIMGDLIKKDNPFGLDQTDNHNGKFTKPTK